MGNSSRQPVWEAILEILPKIADAVTAIVVIAEALKWLAGIQRRTWRTLLYYIHDPIAIFSLWLVIVLVSWQLPHMHPVVAVVMATILVPVQTLLGLRNLRENWIWRKQAVRTVQYFVISTFLVILGLVLFCLTVLVCNLTPENWQAFNSLPNQIAEILPSLLVWNTFTLFSFPVIWISLIPRIEPVDYRRRIRRLGL